MFPAVPELSGRELLREWQQAELFEGAVGMLRQPAELARAAAALDRRPQQGGGPGSRRH
jgi:hypothetical protein